MDFSLLEKLYNSLKEGHKYYLKQKDDVSQSACLYKFKTTYDMSLKMIKRYLKTYYCNPSEVEKYTFSQMIKNAHQESIIEKGLEQWKLFRDTRIKYNESYDQEVTQEILKIVPEFINEMQYLLKQLKERTRE